MPAQLVKTVFTPASKRPRNPNRPKPPEPVRFIPCVHEGNIIEWATCGNCELKHVRACDVHDTCTRGRNNGRIYSCMLCKDYAPPPPPDTLGRIRNLIYFICPIAGNGVWQRNVAQLLKRIDLFNGKRVIGIVTGNVRKRGMRPQRIDSPEEVQSHFPAGCEFVVMPNDRAVGEVAAWRELWSRVLPGESGDVTFYGHAKGVTRPPHSTVHRWTEMLYESTLDYWPLVLEQLREFPVTGSFKKLGYCFPGVPSTFHYSGTFVWWRNADLAARAWQYPPRQWAGTEAMPGILYKPEEAGCLFHEAFGSVLNCYSVDYMTRVVEPEYLKWKAENGNSRVSDYGGVSREAVPA